MDSNAPGVPHSGKNANEQVTEPPQDVNEPALSVLHPDRIAKNTSYLTIALVLQKILSLVYFVYASRSVGSSAIGIYLTAIAITTVFGIFVDIGLSQVLIRETAKRKEQTSEFLNSTLVLKLLTAFIAYAAALIYVNSFPYGDLVRSLVTLTGIVMVLDSFTLTFYAIFRGHQRLQYEAIGTVINKVVVMTIGILGLQFGFGVRWLVVAILVGSAFNFSYAFTLLVKKLAWRPAPRWDSALLSTLLRIAIPFAVAGIFVTIYGYLDQLLLSNPLLVGDRGPSYVGWYGTAYKLTFALQFLPAAVAAAIFPAMSSYFVTSKELLAKTFSRAMFYLMVLSVPLALGIFALADQIILRAYSKAFEASIFPLKILVLSLVPVFLNYPVGYLLNSSDRQTRNTVHIGVVLLLNLFLNLLLIPRFTFNGAAFASLISSFVLFFLGIYVAGSIVAYSKRFLIMTFAKTLIAAGTMAFGVFYFSEKLNIFLLIALAGVWYFGVLVLLRGFTRTDGMKIYHAVMRKVGTD